MQFLYRFGQARRLHRFEHVVDRPRLEGLQRVLVVSGDEDERLERPRVEVPGLGQLGRRLQPALAGHADVEEQHLGPQRKRLAHGRQPIAHGGLHLQFGPSLGQGLLQGGGEQGLVFGNQGAGGGHGFVDL